MEAIPHIELKLSRETSHEVINEGLSVLSEDFISLKVEFSAEAHALLHTVGIHELRNISFEALVNSSFSEEPISFN